MGSKGSSKVILSPTPQIALTWGLSFIVVLFFLLVNFDQDVEFKSVLIFTMVLVVSILGVLAIVSSDRAKFIKGKNSRFFFTEPLTWRRFYIFTPIGFGGAFLWSIISQNIGVQGFGNLSTTELEGLIALYGSGFIFLVTLILSKSVIVPVVAHGAFNAMVFTMSKTGLGGDLLRTQSLPIPEIGLVLSQADQLLTEAIFQFLLVAMAEEHYKILIIATVLAGFKSVYKTSPVKVWLAGIVGVITWGTLHLLRSLS